MSRSGYTEGDCDDEIAFLRYNGWRQAVHNALHGKRGQAFLRELIESLDAMPVHELAANSFTKGGEVCALGSVALKRGIDVSGFEPPDDVEDYGIEPVDRDAVGIVFGIAPSMAAEIMFENDDNDYHNETPALRWARMRRWAECQLTPEDR